MAVVAGVLALIALVALPAVAQESPGTTAATTTSTSVLGTSTTTEATTTTTTEVDDTTTTTTEAEDEEVQGVQVNRGGGLPVTGGSIGVAAVVGLALTGVGIALAAGSRRRRLHGETSI